MSATVTDIDQKQATYRQLALQRREADEVLRSKLLLSYIYHDHALEGIVLTQPEIIDALNGIPRGGDAATLAVQQGIRNLHNAIGFISDEARAGRVKIDLELLKQLHTMLTAEIPHLVGGRYRQEIPLHRAYFHEIQPPKRISYHLNRLVAMVVSPDNKELHPTRFAALVHHELMRIFPFNEHSGTIARLLGNLILERQGYLPCIVHAVDRQRYYEALREGPDALQNIILEALDNALNNAIRYLEAIPPRRLKRAAHS